MREKEWEKETRTIRWIKNKNRRKKNEDKGRGEEKEKRKIEKDTTKGNKGEEKLLLRLFVGVVSYVTFKLL